MKCVRDCIESGNHHTLDPSIGDGKWFAVKALKESSKLQANCSVSSLPFVPSTGWRALPSQDIPSLFKTVLRNMIKGEQVLICYF